MKPHGLFVLAASSCDAIYGPEERADIAKLVRLTAPPQTAESIRQRLELLARVEIIFSGWGAPVLDAALLAAAPKLRAVFYGAGSVRGMVTEAFWRRQIVLSSAWAANAVPVAEFTQAAIILSLKRVWFHASESKRLGARSPRGAVPGAYGSTVGLVSLGMIGRMVARRLQAFDLRVLAYDPFIAPAEARRLGVELVGLDRLFREADVVSLHTPWLKETEGLITGALLESMKPASTFINTSRGAVVREAEMIAVLERRPDLFALLDVTWPEPPVPGSPLYTLPNVILTPHVAGSMDGECRRMGRYMVDELQRYLAGRRLRWRVTQAKAKRMA